MIRLAKRTTWVMIGLFCGVLVDGVLAQQLRSAGGVVRRAGAVVKQLPLTQVQHEELVEPEATEPLEEPELLVDDHSGLSFGLDDCDTCCSDCDLGPRCYGSGCATQNRYWSGFEFLLWWRKGRHFPILVTSSDANTLPENSGVLGLSSTQVLFGGGRFGDDVAPGGRATFGYWIDDIGSMGAGGTFWILGDESVNRRFSNAEFPIHARPFFDTSTNQQDARLIAFPNVADGETNIRSDSEVMGADAYFRHLLQLGCCTRWDLIGGYQFSRIDESLEITSTTVSTAVGGNVAIGTRVDIRDTFDTRNEFHGGQIGLLGEYQYGDWDLGLLLKLGLGEMRQTVTINGQATTTVPNNPSSTVNAGLLAQPSNSGVFENKEFALVPEVNFRAAYRLNDAVDLTMGYTWIYWSDVAQPGDHVNLAINPTQTSAQPVGNPAPLFALRTNDYFVHGLRFGVRCKY